jgi:alkanesulfonate monooxygenase SsuD/methylene tetrahydromethanopterin reductase-like flavin-dependent oxidoreductase (luciferase family)
LRLGRNEFANLGLPFPQISARQAALEEAIVIMRGAWGVEPFSFQGEYFQTTGAHIAPPPRQRPGPPLVIAGGGERVTLRQVARFGDACQLGSFGMVSGSTASDDVRRKLEVLRQHYVELGRPYESVLRTHFTGWLLLAEDEARLAEKVRRAFPEGIDQRYTGAWAGYAMPATVEQAVALYRELVAAGIQYFVVATLDAADEETIHLLAERVMQAVQPV